MTDEKERALRWALSEARPDLTPSVVAAIVSTRETGDELPELLATVAQAECD